MGIFTLFWHNIPTYSAAFELLFETDFAINMSSTARLLVYCRRKFFLRIEKYFFVFSNVILSISNTPFDNSIQWMNKMWISFGYNVKKYNVDELNSPWEKNCFAFFSWFATLQWQWLEFTSQFAKCEVIIQTLFRHNQVYPGIIMAYSDTFRILFNHGILRTRTYLEPEVYLKPCQRSMRKHYNGYNYLCKFQLLQYQLFRFSTLWNEHHDFFKVKFLLLKYLEKYWGQEGLGLGTINFDIPWNFIKE